MADLLCIRTYCWASIQNSAQHLYKKLLCPSFLKASRMHFHILQEILSRWHNEGDIISWLLG